MHSDEPVTEQRSGRSVGRQRGRVPPGPDAPAHYTTKGACWQSPA